MSGNNNLSGIRTGNVQVKGMPVMAGGSKPRGGSKGDAYPSDPVAACKAGFEEGRSPKDPGEGNPLKV